MVIVINKERRKAPEIRIFLENESSVSMASPELASVMTTETIGAKKRYKTGTNCDSPKGLP